MAEFLEEVQGDIWEHPCPVKVIPINGFVKSNGALVMGAGLALEAAKRYPELPFLWGDLVSSYGYKKGMTYTSHKDGITLVSITTKHVWYEQAKAQLIVHGLSTLSQGQSNYGWNQVVLPRVGCGLGQLDWDSMRSYVGQYLGPPKHPEGRFIVVDKNNGDTNVTAE